MKVYLLRLIGEDEPCAIVWGETVIDIGTVIDEWVGPGDVEFIEVGDGGIWFNCKSKPMDEPPPNSYRAIDWKTAEASERVRMSVEDAHVLDDWEPLSAEWEETHFHLAQYNQNRGTTKQGDRT